MIKVFLLDDHEVVRAGLRDLLESEEEIEVVGEASTAQEAMDRIPAVQPNVAILDVRLRDDEADGIAACRDIRSAHPEIACLMLTSYADDEALFASIMAGAAGYLLKEIRGREIVDAVRRAARGESLLDPTLTQQFFDRLRGGGPEDALLARLTDRERKVLDLVAEGKTNREIGAELYLAEKTVKNYVSNILSKLGMQRRTEAAVFATRLHERERRGR
ncbi:MAG: response regulator transcription factor [Acidimicrobiales bacterium]